MFSEQAPRDQMVTRSSSSPIKQAFSKIKHWMRHVQKRTIEDTWRHIGRLVETIQPEECANYLANAGYASVKT